MTEEAARKFIGPSGLHSRWKEQRRKLPPPPPTTTTVGADVSCTLSSCHSGTLKLYDVLLGRNVYMTQDERERARYVTTAVTLCHGAMPIHHLSGKTFPTKLRPTGSAQMRGEKFYGVRFSFFAGIQLWNLCWRAGPRMESHIFSRGPS